MQPGTDKARKNPLALATAGTFAVGLLTARLGRGTN
jgi:hypothetical protein